MHVRDLPQAGRMVAERRWYNAARAKGKSVQRVTANPMTWMSCAQFQRNIGRSAMTGVVSILEYALMLIVMIYNIGLFFAVIVGLMAGSLLFGHVVEHAAGGGLAEAEETHKEEALGARDYVAPTAYVINGTGCHCDP